MSFRSRLKTIHAEGFTLIEILISIALLSVISLAIYQTTSQTFQLREKLMGDGEFYNTIRLSMGVIERDFSMMYSPTIIMPEKKAPGGGGGLDNGGDDELAKREEMEAVLSKDLGNTTTFWAGATDPSGIRPMRFSGTENKMSFVSLSHVRVYKEKPESEFLKVTYELRDDTEAERDSGLKELVKTASPNAFGNDDDKDEMKRTYRILGGIKKWEFQYYRKEKDQWTKTWDSDTQDLKNLYPDLMKVTVEVEGSNRRVFDGEFKFRPEVPLRGLEASH